MSSSFTPSVGTSNATSETYGAVKSDRYQEKVLASNFVGGTSSASEVTDLTMNNLIVGRRYRVLLAAYCTGSSASSDNHLYLAWGPLSSTANFKYFRMLSLMGSTTSYEFTAVGTTLKFFYGSSIGNSLVASDNNILPSGAS